MYRQVTLHRGLLSSDWDAIDHLDAPPWERVEDFASSMSYSYPDHVLHRLGRDPIPSGVVDIRARIAMGRGLVVFALVPGVPGGRPIGRSGSESAEPVDGVLYLALRRIPPTGAEGAALRRMRVVRHAGEWVLVASDWAGDGYPSDRYRTRAEARAARIAEARRWAVHAPDDRPVRG